MRRSIPIARARTSGVVLAIAAVAVVALVLGGGRARAGDEIDCKAAEADQTELTRLMCPINREWKTVLDGFEKPDRYAALAETVASMRKKVGQAADVLPRDVRKEADAADRDAASADYRTRIEELGAKLDDLRAAFESGAADKIKEDIAAIKKMKKSGHDKYNTEGDF